MHLWLNEHRGTIRTHLETPRAVDGGSTTTGSNQIAGPSNHFANWVQDFNILPCRPAGEATGPKDGQRSVGQIGGDTQFRVGDQPRLQQCSMADHPLLEPRGGNRDEDGIWRL